MIEAIAGSKGDVAAIARAHRKGRAMLALGVVLGVALAGWIGGWPEPHPTLLSQSSAPGFGGQGGVRGVPRPRQGLTLTSENRGQVLFGRYCDSCHTAGRETTLGASLRSPQFKREFPTEQKIMELVRTGGFDMPAYSREFLADADLAEIAKYVAGLPEERR